MTEVFTDVYETYKKYKIIVPTAAYVTAVKKIVNTVQAWSHMKILFLSFSLIVNSIEQSFIVSVY